ncbi:MAG: Rrf2 family transcriptional regulator [Deltaproteobacteria bacterium]|nr:Rrf2 family transcriptional regulator [Deltaproteobacteria bacterium]
MSAVLQQSDYAIRCLLFLVEHRGRLATKTEIANAVDAPGLFVAKILQRLVKANVLVSVRGIHGGFSLAREPAAISLLDVLVASQASLAFRPCVLNPKACTLQETCPVRRIWVNIYECTVRELRRTTFDMLSRVHKARLRNHARRPGKRK